MADIIKKYVDLDGLTEYNRLIKSFISTEDAKAYKTILLVTDPSTGAQTINCYKKYNATSSDTPDFSYRVGSLGSVGYVPSFSGTTLSFDIGTITQSTSGSGS